MTDLWQSLDDVTQQRLIALVIAAGVIVLASAVGWFVLNTVFGDV